MAYQKQLYPIVAVNAVIFTEDNKFILTRRVDNSLWCLPGGLVEAGETVEEAVHREVYEETGLKCAIDNFIGVYSSNNQHQPFMKTHSIILTFRCRIIDGIPSLSDEVSEIGIFELDNLPKDIIENQRIRILHSVKNATSAHVC